MILDRVLPEGTGVQLIPEFTRLAGPAPPVIGVLGPGSPRVSNHIGVGLLRSATGDAERLDIVNPMEGENLAE